MVLSRVPNGGKNMKYLKLFEEFNETLSQYDINEILKGYLDAAFFTEEERLNDEYAGDYNSIFADDEHPDEMEKLVKLSSNLHNKSISSFCREDIEDNSLIKAYLDIKEFIRLAGTEAINYAIDELGLEQLGSDFWYSRNHHGVGFFDRKYDKEIKTKLTNAAHQLKEVDMFINDDMKLSFSNENS